MPGASPAGASLPGASGATPFPGGPYGSGGVPGDPYGTGAFPAGGSGSGAVSVGPYHPGYQIHGAFPVEPTRFPAGTSPAGEYLPDRELRSDHRAVPALLSRSAAAEVGIYVGAGLVVVAIGVVAAQGWGGWSSPLRLAATALTAVALAALGLFILLTGPRPLDGVRRRAASLALPAGVALALACPVVALGLGAGSPVEVRVVHAAVSVATMIGIARAARSPVSETALLAACAWSVWLLAPGGPWRWGALIALGVAWALLAGRVAAGRRTAIVAGTSLALLAGVGLSTGPWAWPARAALAGAAGAGLVAFLRGRANGWLALSAAAATALAASVAGSTLGPALAMLVSGLSTTVVSWVALRAARAPKPSGETTSTR